MLIKNIAASAFAVIAVWVFAQSVSAGSVAGAATISTSKQIIDKANGTFTLIQRRRRGVGGGAFRGRGYYGGRGYRGYGYRRSPFFYGAPFIAAPFAFGAYAYDDGYYGYSGGGSCFARCRQFRGPEFCRYNAREFC